MDWLTKELKGNPQEPSIDLSNAELVGGTTICSNKTNTYSINVLSSCIGSVNWTVSSNIEIISKSHNKITVEPKSGDIENAGFVSVSVPSAGIEETMGVWVGLPNSNNLRLQKLSSYNLYSNQWTKFRAAYPIRIYEENEPFDFAFEWQIPNSQVRSFSDTSYKDISPNYSEQLNIGIKMINECGCSDWRFEQFDVMNSGGSGNDPIKIKVKI